MPYLGELSRAGGYSITVVTDAPNSRIAVTVFHLRRDRLSDVETLVLIPDSNGVAQSGLRTIPSGVARTDMLISATGGTATATINGNSVPLAQDAVVQFDLV